MIIARTAVIIHTTGALSLSDANDDSGWSYTQTAIAGGNILLVQWGILILCESV